MSWSDAARWLGLCHCRIVLSAKTTVGVGHQMYEPERILLYDVFMISEINAKLVTLFVGVLDNILKVK